MSQAIIRVEGIGKRYHIGGPKPSHFALRDVIADLPRRTVSKLRGRHLREEFWALRDIDLEIDEGDVVALVGRNGAGKSTLLKILSRIVEPTTGRGVLHGHVSSLLEVGTGFHFELTGRENIFLNGAILGMRRREIQAKFDEIVEFSEIEKFIDTPVKFYSSGMYVRLAFSVAAHLEPDILIIDEVLSVGDDRFQRKSLAKMSSIARSGRTVIFVSHNMSAVADLCTRGVLLQEGRMLKAGPVGEIVQAYLRRDGSSNNARFERAPGDPATRILSAVTLLGGAGEPRSRFDYGDPMRVRVETRPGVAAEFGLEVRVKTSSRQAVAYLSSWVAGAGRFRAGETIEIALPALQLVADTYTLDFICRVPPERELDSWGDEVTFELTTARPGGSLVDIHAAEKLGAVVIDDAAFARG